MIDIRGRKFSEEEFKKVLLESFSKCELAKGLGFDYSNGKLFKELMLIVKSLQLNISHFSDEVRHIKKQKYNRIKKNCPICSTEFLTLEGHKKEKTTCSSKCSNTFFSKSKHTELSNLKRSLKLTKVGKVLDVQNNKNFDKEKIIKLKVKKLFLRKCKKCNNEFETTTWHRKFCSHECKISIYRTNEYRKKTSELHLKRIKETGKVPSWMSRDKMARSYPEKYIESLLNENNLFRDKDFKIELKCGRWFIDFAFEQEKIALEVDGKQHNFPDRKASDERKDSHLRSEGWRIIRIKWKKVDLNYRNELIDIIKGIKNKPV
ncbi:MAG: DUF559 domain-containing protein [Chitinophagales bacterium]|nr:DUF559 domain-containing protein [Chitinophagales bacterium]